MNMSAGCELMGKPCLCWLSAADVQGSITVGVQEHVEAALRCFCVDHSTLLTDTHNMTILSFSLLCLCLSGSISFYIYLSRATNLKYDASSTQEYLKYSSRDLPIQGEIMIKWLLFLEYTRALTLGNRTLAMLTRQRVSLPPVCGLMQKTRNKCFHVCHMPLVCVALYHLNSTLYTT